MATNGHPRPLRLERAVGRHIFGEDVVGYDSARLGYPQGLYDRLLARVGPASDLRVLEIGAGTGLATRDLLAWGPARLVAVEPDPRLASYLAQALAVTHPSLEIETQPFEAVDVQSATFDLVVAAASFHWLEPASALVRIREALKPRGVLATWWNVYRAPGIGDDFADAVVPLLSGIPLPPSEGGATHYSLNEAWHRGLLESNGFDSVEHWLFRRDRTLDTREARTLYSTYSFVRQLAPEERERLLDRVGELVETRFGGRAPNVVLTPLYIAAKRS